jgi:hypothetical protein
MDWQSVINILTWLVPSGAAGSVVVWYANKTTRGLREIKESHDAYKIMYEDVKNTLIEEIDEKKALRKAVGRLERAIAAVGECRYSHDCPVDRELRKPETSPNEYGKGVSRQRSHQGSGNKSDSIGAELRGDG